MILFTLFEDEADNFVFHNYLPYSYGSLRMLVISLQVLNKGEGTNPLLNGCDKGPWLFYCLLRFEPSSVCDRIVI